MLYYLDHCVGYKHTKIEKLNASSQKSGQVAGSHEGHGRQNMPLSLSKVSEQLLPKFR